MKGIPNLCLMHSLRERREWTEPITRIVHVLTGLLVFLIPFPRFTALYELAFYVALALSILLHVSGHRRFSLTSPLTIWFSVFFVWISFGLFYALDPLNSINDIYGHLIKYFLLYYLMINSFTSYRGFLTLIWIIAAGAGLFAWSAVFSHYVVSQNPLSTRLGDPAIQGLTSDYVGYVTLPGLLLSLILVEEYASARGKIFAFFLAAGAAAITIFAQSKATFIALCCSLAILYGRRKAALGAAVFFLVSVMVFLPAFSERFSVEDITQNSRIGIYLTTAEIIRDYPIAGIGFGMQTYGNPSHIDLDAYSRRIPAKYRLDPPIRSPHNTLLDTAVRTGCVGLLIYLYMQFVFVKMAWTVIRGSRDPKIKRLGLCVLSVYGVIFIQGLFSDGAFGPQALMLYFSFALMTILWKIVEVDHNTPVMAAGVLKGAQK